MGPLKRQFLWRCVSRGNCMKIWLLTISFILVFAAAPGRALAQDGGKSLVDQSLHDAMIVAGAGVGGAVLGLSTLSFVEEPSEHMKNILVGGAIGIIVGVGLVAYMQATKSETIYKQSYHLDSLDFGTNQRLAWHQKEHGQLVKTPASQVGYQFSF